MTKLKRSIFLLMLSLLVLTACINNGNDVKANNKPYYYNPFNVARYKVYAQKNPQLEETEVIWHVEADIDKEPYTDMKIISVEVEDDKAILINKHFKVSNEYIPENLVKVQGNEQATQETAEAFLKMEADAKKEGLTLKITSGYRTLQMQDNIYKNYVKKYGTQKAEMYAARMNSSEHHTGRALDIVDQTGTLEGFGESASGKWLNANANKYGFILRYGKELTNITGYGYEPWHVTYVGTDVSGKFSTGEVKTLEEYWVKYVKYKQDTK